MSDFDDITPVPGIPAHLQLNMAKVRAAIDKVTAERDDLRAERDRLVGDLKSVIVAEVEKAVGPMQAERDALLVRRDELLATIASMQQVYDAAMLWRRAGGAPCDCGLCTECKLWAATSAVVTSPFVKGTPHEERGKTCSDRGCEREAGHDGLHMSRAWNAATAYEVVDEWGSRSTDCTCTPTAHGHLTSCPKWRA